MKEKLIALVKEAVKSLINAYQWKQEFSAAGEDILGLEHDKKSELFSQLEVMFSEENMKNLFSSIDDCNGSEYISVIRNEMNKVFGTYKIEKNERDKYIDIFIKTLLYRIEKKDPILFQQISLNDVSSKLDATFEAIGGIRDEISALIDKIDKFDFAKEEIFSIDEVNSFILRNTNPQINLDFYDYENNEFRNSLISRLNTKVIYIQGETVEEAVYGTVNILRNYKSEYGYKRTYIVKSKDTWDKLNGIIWDSILIPYFYSDEIPMISGNTVIYIRGKEELEKKDTLHLGKRTRRNLHEMLIKCGVESDYSNKIVNDSNVIYSSIKRMLFVGDFQSPKWYNEIVDKENLIPSLLFGMWTNKEGDIDAFESCLRNDFQTYERSLYRAINTSDPYIIKYALRSRIYYKIANVEEAWQLIGKYLNKQSAINFLDMARYLLYDIKPKFDLPQEQHYYSSILGYDSDFTDDIRSGIQRTLILMKKYATDDIKFEVDKCIEDILNETNSDKEWFALSEYFDDLIEAAPDKFLSRIETELCTEDSNFLKIFKKNGGSGIFSRNYYTHILWGLEKLLFVNQYVSRVVNILVKLNNQNFVYGTSNSPKETLTRIFCAWQHEINYGIDEKKELFGYLLKNDDLNIELIRDILPDRSMSNLYMPLCKPKYISYIVSDELYYKHQVRETYLYYMKAFIEYAKSDFDKWILLFDDCFFIDMGLGDTVNTITSELIIGMDDESKYRLYKKMRDFIYRHRFYQEAEWSLDEKAINLVNDLFNKISFADNTYNYVYLFDDYHIALLEPIPYKDDNHMKKNDEIIDTLRIELITNIISRNIDLIKLIDLSEENNGAIGSYVAKYYHNGTVDWEFVICLENMGRNQTIKRYFCELQELGLNLITSLNHISNDVNINSETINILLQVTELNEESLYDLESLPDHIVKKYWDSYFSYKHIDNTEIIRKVLDKLKEYGNYVAALDIVHHQVSVEAEEHIEILSDLLEFFHKETNRTCNLSHEAYLIEKSLIIIYKCYEKLQRYSDEIIRIEIGFMNILVRDFELKFVINKLSKEPSFFAELISYSYKTDAGQQVHAITEINSGVTKMAFSLLYELKFCPVSKEGQIDLNELEEYIDEFLRIMKQQDQSVIGKQLLGERLSNAPEDENGFYPNENICKIIEKHYTVDLEQGFNMGVMNSRGVFSGSEGTNELALSKRYEDYAKKCSIKYPKTSLILMGISKRYKLDSDEYRKSAEYEF